MFKRLTRLTTINDSNINKNANEVHPDHVKALRRAELIKMNGKLPTFQDLLVKEEKDKKKKEKKNENNDKNKCPWNAFFCVGHCEFWKKTNAYNNVRNKKEM